MFDVYPLNLAPPWSSWEISPLCVLSKQLSLEDIPHSCCVTTLSSLWPHHHLRKQAPKSRCVVEHGGEDFYCCAWCGLESRLSSFGFGKKREWLTRDRLDMTFFRSVEFFGGVWCARMDEALAWVSRWACPTRKRIWLDVGEVLPVWRWRSSSFGRVGDKVMGWVSLSMSDLDQMA
jgi:hypothetical protein